MARESLGNHALEPSQFSANICGAYGITGYIGAIPGEHENLHGLSKNRKTPADFWSFIIVFTSPGK